MSRYQYAAERWDLVSAYRGEVYYLKPMDETPQQLGRLADAQRFERAVFRRLIPKTYQLDKSVHLSFVFGVLHTLSDKEQLTALQELVRALPAGPRSVAVAGWYGESAGWLAERAGDDAVKAFREAMEAGPNPAYKAAADGLKGTLRVVAAREKAEAAFAPAPRAEAANPGGVKLTPISLTLAAQTPGQAGVHAVSPRLGGVLRVGPQTDFVWGAMSSYLMKEKGVLRSVPGLSEWSWGAGHVRFDGKYVWLSGPRQRQDPSLYVLDPETERVWDVSAAAGLPTNTPDELKARPQWFPYPIAPLGPGRACVGGRVGERAWVAAVTFDPATGTAAAKVVAEARAAADPQDANQWADPDVAFTPSFLHPLAGPDGTQAARVVVGRSRSGRSPFAASDRHALLVDPAGTAKSEVIREPIGPFTIDSSSLALCGTAGEGVLLSRIDPIVRPAPPAQAVETAGADGRGDRRWSAGGDPTDPPGRRPMARGRAAFRAEAEARRPAPGDPVPGQHDLPELVDDRAGGEAAPARGHPPAGDTVDCRQRALRPSRRRDA